MDKSIFILISVTLIYAFSTSFAQQATCDYKIEILVDGDKFESEEFKWRMRAIKVDGRPTNITGTAKIEDEDGKSVKSYNPWISDSISKQKTSSEYSPNLRIGKYNITAEIEVECDDTNKDNNIDSKTIEIKGEKEADEAKDKSKNIEIEKQNNDEMEIKASQNIIAIDPKKPVATEEIDNVIKLTTKNEQNQEPLSTFPVQPQIVYESSNEKAQDLIMVFLLALSILLNIILIWKR